MDEVSVTATATVSNVVCGFDCLGFALDSPCDRFVLRRVKEKGVRIINRDDFRLPVDPKRNIAGVTLFAMLEDSDADLGSEFESNKVIKPGSGIGSSAASACGAAVAANEFLGRRYSTSELIEFALIGEATASGARHADNVAPCTLGGFTLVRSTEPLDIVELDFPPLFATILHPQIEIKTSAARELLPKSVPLGTAVNAWANLGAFVAGLAAGDLDLLARAMTDDIVEPARKSLIPLFDEIKAASLNAGAIGGGISGSGPSMFMLSPDEETARTVEKGMQNLYSSIGIVFKTYISPISHTGVKVD